MKYHAGGGQKLAKLCYLINEWPLNVTSEKRQMPRAYIFANNLCPIIFDNLFCVSKSNYQIFSSKSQMQQRS